MLLLFCTIITGPSRFLNMKTLSKTLFGGLKALERQLKRDEWATAKYTIILDENTFQYCLPLLISGVEALQEAEFVEVPAGEECKSLEVAAQVWQTLIDGGADRNHVLVNLGGGSVCDLGGFVAAGYMRGIRHINIPTTLLAMVDAAIGGKTAIDFGGIKNSIGHFYPASLTITEPAFVATLPQTEVLNGKMEMVKTAAVANPDLYAVLLANDSIPLNAIKETVRIKESIVKADPYDHDIRHILNFGHTFGHAIEVHAHLPHGIAVGIGMLAAMYLSVKKTGLDSAIYHDYSMWLRRYVDIPQFTLHDIEPMLDLMHHDKKNAAASTQCVLLQALGAAMIDVEVSDNEVRDALLSITRQP